MSETNDGGRSGLSGLCLLHGAKEAFAARLNLIRSARECLDVQYYIWHDDLSGALILDQIAAAAERGVKVRLLLDDNGIPGLDGRLAALNEHPNIAVRLFNPFTFRRFRGLNWLLEFRRLNARMHAKSLTADHGSTIIGGRNIGDEYFGAKPQGQFDDLDVLAVGPVVAEVERVFEDHWQCSRAHPIEAVVGRISPRARAKAMRIGRAAATSEAARRYLEGIEAHPFYCDLKECRQEFVWAPAQAVAAMPRAPGELDDTPVGLDELLPNGLAAPDGELILVSGYFVPTSAGCGELAELRRSGVKVLVLTNSFAATDVGVVHAGYAPYRPLLLRQDIELFEMPAPGDAPKRANRFVRSGSNRARRYSGKSLHAKLFIVDRRQLYIGSANFDPRSARINTELGFFVESRELAQRLASAFETAARNSYRLGLSADGELLWTDQRDDVPIPERTEPGTNIFTRMLIRLLSKVPIEHHL